MSSLPRVSRWLAALLLVASGCGKARSNPPGSEAPSAVLGDAACYPLGHAALAASLEGPLAVGRDAFNIVYALSRVGSTSLLWRSLDDRLIAYPVVAENRAGAGGAIFGADDGNQGFALSLVPEVDPTILRVFQRLSDAVPDDGSTFTTGGATLEVLSPAALSEFTPASEISPALVVGSFRTVPDDAPSASLLLVRTEPGADAPLALFYGEGNVLAQRELLEVSEAAETLTLSFQIDGLDASAQLATDRRLATGTLRAQGRERSLLRGAITARGLEQLGLRCSSPAPEAWLRQTRPKPLSELSCSEAAPLFACVATTGPVLADTGTVVIAAGDARVVEMGSGLSQAPRDGCVSRAAPLTEDARVNVSWARLEHSGGQLWLTVAGPSLELPLTVGQRVSMSSWDEPGFGWESWVGELLVRSVESGELLLWMGQRNDISELNGTAELDLLPGPERCVTLPDCGGGVLSRYALASRLIAGADAASPNDTQLIPYGERDLQGGYYVYNGGIESITAAPLCVFQPFSRARIAIWKAPGG